MNVREAGSRGGASAWSKNRPRMLEIAQAGAAAMKAKAATKRKVEVDKAHAKAIGNLILRDEGKK